MNKMTTCKTCGAEIAKSAKVCPHCGARNLPPMWARLSILAVVLVAAVIFVVHTRALFSGSSPANVQAASAENQASAPEKSGGAVVVDKGGIRITYNGYKMMQNTSEQCSLYINLTVENDSAQEIVAGGVSVVDASINGVAKTASSAATACVATPSGKESVMDFVISDFAGTGIESADDADKINELGFKVTVYNKDFSDAVITSDAMTVTP